MYTHMEHDYSPNTSPTMFYYHACLTPPSPPPKEREDSSTDTWEGGATHLCVQFWQPSTVPILKSHRFVCMILTTLSFRALSRKNWRYQKSNKNPCMYIKEGQYHGQKKKSTKEQWQAVHVNQRRAIPWSKEKYTQKSNNKPCMYINEGQYHGQKKKTHKRANYEMQKNKHYRKLRIEQHEPQ